MASSTSYEPDGFDAANLNPFAQESPLSQSVWGSSELTMKIPLSVTIPLNLLLFKLYPLLLTLSLSPMMTRNRAFSRLIPNPLPLPLLSLLCLQQLHPLVTTPIYRYYFRVSKPDPTEPRTPTATTPADTGVLGNPKSPILNLLKPPPNLNHLLTNNPRKV